MNKKDAPKLVRGLSLLDATMIVVGSMIGSGIFIVSAESSRLVGSPGWLIAAWALAGVLTITGALCCAELAAMWPRAGGQYVFLSQAFGPLWGFLYGWTFLLAINTGFVAAVSVAFAKYLGVFLRGISEDVVLWQLGRFRFTTAQAVALVVVVALTYINIRGLRTGAWVQNVFTIAKVAGVAALVVLAIGSGRGCRARWCWARSA
jgi:APA family basic amino acid/polyamine antiporter